MATNSSTTKMQALVVTYVLLLSVSFLQGCKTQVIAHPGGHISSTSGEFYCWVDSSGYWNPEECVSEANDIYYEQTFVAKALSGYRFLGWSNGDRHLCGGVQGPCKLITEGFKDNEVLLEILKSEDQVFYLRPLFARQYSDTLNVPGLYNGVWKYSNGSGEWDCKLFGTGEHVSFPIEKSEITWRLNVDPSGRVEVVYNYYAAGLGQESDLALFDFATWGKGGEYRHQWKSGNISYLVETSFEHNNGALMKGDLTMLINAGIIQHGYLDCKAKVPITMTKISQ